MIPSMLLLALASVIWFPAAFAQTTPSPRFIVSVKISGDAAIASEIESCIRQELALLSNVEISEDKPDYTINVIAMEIVDKEQVPMGIALTWLSLYHPKGFFQDCSLVEDYRLLTFDKEEIHSNCRDLVARFNTKSLEPHRKVFQKPKP